MLVQAEDVYGNLQLFLPSGSQKQLNNMQPPTLPQLPHRATNDDNDGGHNLIVGQFLFQILNKTNLLSVFH